MTGLTCSPEELPKLTPQHCLRTRFNGSSCTLCRDACPQGLPDLDGVIAIDAAACGGCQLCAGACPSGAIEPQVSEAALTAALKRTEATVIACHRATEQCHLQVPCVGFLSEEYLLALYTAAAPKITVNVIGCGHCDNYPAVRRLLERIHALQIKTGVEISGKVSLADNLAALHFKPAAVDRRGFFAGMTRSLLREATAALTPPATPGNTPASYADKHLPLRRKLLDYALNRILAEEQQRIAALFRWEVERSAECDGCLACTKACPTGAVSENFEEGPFSLQFDPAICAGCGLCVEFCLNGAVSLHGAA
jgi:ferredoxin